MEALEDKRVRLQPECKKRLNDRIEMWSYAAKVMIRKPPEVVISSVNFRLFKELHWLSCPCCKTG